MKVVERKHTIGQSLVNSIRNAEAAENGHFIAYSKGKSCMVTYDGEYELTNSRQFVVFLDIIPTEDLVDMLSNLNGEYDRLMNIIRNHPSYEGPSNMPTKVSLVDNVRYHVCGMLLKRGVRL
jgi:hypothetical protein